MSGNQTSGKEGGVQCVMMVVCILDIVCLSDEKRNSSLPFFCRPTASSYAS